MKTKHTCFTALTSLALTLLLFFAALVLPIRYDKSSASAGRPSSDINPKPVYISDYRYHACLDEEDFMRRYQYCDGEYYQCDSAEEILNSTLHAIRNDFTVYVFELMHTDLSNESIKLAFQEIKEENSEYKIILLTAFHPSLYFDRDTGDYEEFLHYIDDYYNFDQLNDDFIFPHFLEWIAEHVEPSAFIVVDKYIAQRLLQENPNYGETYYSYLAKLYGDQELKIITIGYYDDFYSDFVLYDIMSGKMYYGNEIVKDQEDLRIIMTFATHANFHQMLGYKFPTDESEAQWVNQYAYMYKKNLPIFAIAKSYDVDPTIDYPIDIYQYDGSFSDDFWHTFNEYRPFNSGEIHSLINGYLRLN